jgi:hypothetical protein
MSISPYGSWASLITSDLIVADAIKLDQVALDGNAIYWTESQPQKQGRTFIYRSVGGGEPRLLTPDDGGRFNVRTRVSESRSAAEPDHAAAAVGTSGRTALPRLRVR